MRAFLLGFAVVLGACSHFADVGELRTASDSSIVDASTETSSETSETSSIVAEDAPALPKCTGDDEDGDGFGRAVDGETCLVDCDDSNPNVFPGQTKFFSFADDTAEFDYNCDHVTEKRFTAIARCEDGAGGCVFVEGWLDPLPGCGMHARWLKACTKLGTAGCGAGTANIEVRVQECR